MENHKKLIKAKRILAMLLAAVIGVTSLPPATVNAAELTPVVSEDAVDTTIADTENETADTADQSSAKAEDETDSEEATIMENPELVAEPESEEDTPELKTSIEVDLTEQERTAVYSGKSAFADENFAMLFYSSVHVYVDGVENQDALQAIKSSWKQKTDEGEVPLEGNPVNAGTYYLDITLVAKEGCYGAAEERVTFTITKAPLVVYAQIDTVKPGTKAGDVTVSSLYAYDRQTETKFWYKPDDKSTEDVDESSDSALNYKITIKDAITGNELKENELLNKGSDYVAELTLSFTDKVSDSDQGNYELLPASFDIEMSGLVSTYMELKFTNESGYTKTYDQKPVTLVKDEHYTVKVLRSDNNEEISNPELKEYWTDKDGNLLEAAPTQVGSYQFVVSYEPDDNVLSGCKKQLTVVIDPVRLIIKPTVDKKSVKFYPGMTASEAAEQAGYQVLDAKENDITAQIDKNSFWGTYVSDGVPYPMVPTFTVWEIITQDTDVSYKKLNRDEKLEAGKRYCIRFSGYKGYYELNGKLNYVDRDINRGLADSNYQVDTYYETLDNYFVDISLTNVTPATIDASAIYVAGTGADYENPIVEEYDAKSIYAKDTDFMKAVVKPEGGADKVLAKDTDSALAYTWFRQNGETDGAPIWEEMGSLPVNAGNYKLKITYEDAKYVYYAEPAEVFYKIEKQKVIIVATEDQNEYTAWAGETVSQFLTRSKPECGISTMEENGQPGDKLTLKDNEYVISYNVEKSTDKVTWSALQDTDAFEMENVSYRLKAKLQAENYEAEETVIPQNVVVKKMGTTELEVKLTDENPASYSKTYDGEAFDIAKSLESDLFTIKTKEEEPKQINAAELGLVYTWRDSEGKPVDTPVNAGEYHYYVSFPGAETYKSFEEVKVASVTIGKRLLVIEPVLKEEPVVAGPAYQYNIEELSSVNDLLGFYVNYTQTKFSGVAEKDKEAFTYRNFYDEGLGCYHDGWSAFKYDELNTGIFISGVLFCLTTKDGDLIDPDDILRSNTEYTVRLYSSQKRLYSSSDYILTEPYQQNYRVVEKTKCITPVRGNSSVTASVAILDSVVDMTHTITAKQAIPFSYDVKNEETEENLNGNFVEVTINIPSEYRDLPSAALYENSIKKAGGFNIKYNSNSRSITAVFDASAKDKEFDIRWEAGYTEHFILDFTGATLLTDLRDAVAPKSLAFNGPSTKMVVGETQQLDVKLTKVQESDTIRLIYSVDNKTVLHVEDDGSVVALAKGSANVTVSPAHMVGGKLVAIEGAKTAKVKITVNNVTAPKIKSVIASDADIKVEYTKAPNGTRHEIYVLEGKNKKETDFVGAIASMQNNKWQGIFAAAPIYDYDEEDPCYINDLKADTAYTVYVRNVTLASTFADGCKLTESHAGAVKSITTAKQLPSSYRLSFADEEAIVNEYTGITYSSLTIPLTKGSTTAIVEGLYYDEKGNEHWEKLPLSKTAKSHYAESGLAYKIYEIRDDYERSDEYLTYVYDYESKRIRFIYETSQVSIDKKGKITAKSAGEFFICVTDKNYNLNAFAILNVTASADSITGKNVKLKTGQSMSLYDMVVYKEGRKVVAGSFDKEIVVDEALLKAFEDSPCFRLDGTTVTATKPGRLTVTVKDAYIGDKTTTVTISATAMDPVKNLKVTDVTDKNFNLEFTHSGYAEGFRITVTDARGNIVKDAYKNAEDLYSEGSGKYSYQVTRLNAKSKYNVSVTAVFEDAKSKSVKKSVTTTLKPISYVSLDNSSYGGADIVLADTNDFIESADLVSGITYSLLLDGNLVNYDAVFAETDSLTWTSTNKKVATVKATKGSVFATLKALKAGTTTIEVRSKITKAVIARHEITIKAVGNGYDYEDSDYEDSDYEDSDVVKTLWLNSGIPVSTTRDGEYKWLKFTALSDGNYCFYSEGDDDNKAWFFWDMSIGDNASSDDLNDDCVCYNDDGGEDSNFSKTIYLSAGQTIYIAVGDYTLSDPMTCTVYVEKVYVEKK